MAQAQAQETIFVQTDPTFDIVLNSLTELKTQNRLLFTHSQTASLQDIESNNADVNQRFIFGGLYGFARTTRSVLRMCMLAATNINGSLWPTIGKYSQPRNVAKIAVLVQLADLLPFSLAYSKIDAKKYWSKYDQLYPHFLIQQKILSVPIDVQISLPSMMIIVRSVGSFTEVIVVNTTFTVTRRNQVSKCFNSYIHVSCIRHLIQEDFQGVECMDMPFTKSLKELLNYGRIMGGWQFLKVQAQEIIFVQTDPTFDIVLNSLTELKNQNRLLVTHSQTASLQDIESNNPDMNLRFIFGGLYGFARTASSVLRMCMLAATNINDELWPTIGQYSQERNQEKMVVHLPGLQPFSLADNQPDAGKYWSKYDQLYPHFLIQQAFRDAVPPNTLISLPRMMIIVRSVGSLTEFIEINTTFTATRSNPLTNFFNSHIYVVCIVRLFQKNELMDGPFTTRLNAELRNLPPGMNGLPAAFGNLSIQ